MGKWVTVRNVQNRGVNKRLRGKRLEVIQLIAMDAIENKEGRELTTRDGMRSVEGGGEATKRLSRTLQELGEGAILRYLNATSKWKLARRLSFVSRLFAGQLTTKKTPRQPWAEATRPEPLVPWVSQGRARCKEGRQDTSGFTNAGLWWGGCSPTCRAPAVATLTVQSSDLFYFYCTSVSEVPRV